MKKKSFLLPVLFLFSLLALMIEVMFEQRNPESVKALNKVQGFANSRRFFISKAPQPVATADKTPRALRTGGKDNTLLVKFRIW